MRSVVQFTVLLSGLSVAGMAGYLAQMWWTGSADELGTTPFDPRLMMIAVFVLNAGALVWRRIESNQAVKLDPQIARADSESVAFDATRSSDARDCAQPSPRTAHEAKSVTQLLSEKLLDQRLAQMGRALDEILAKRDKNA